MSHRKHGGHGEWVPQVPRRGSGCALTLVASLAMWCGMYLMVDALVKIFS